MPDNNSYVKYGTHSHAKGEVDTLRFEIIPEFSERGRRRTHLTKADYGGEISGTGPANLTPKINKLISAYADDGHDWQFFNSDGLATNHAIVSHASNMTGTRILHRSWPRSDAVEYDTKRYFRIVVAARFIDCEDQIVRVQETVRGLGTTGERWAFQNTQAGPKRVQIWPATSQTIVQEGFAMGLQGYPSQVTVAPPLLGSAHEHLERRMITHIGPRTERLMNYDYGIRWRYVFEVAVNTPLYPHT